MRWFAGVIDIAARKAPTNEKMKYCDGACVWIELHQFDITSIATIKQSNESCRDTTVPILSVFRLNVFCLLRSE
jgi:hypothetical protein